MTRQKGVQLYHKKEGDAMTARDVQKILGARVLTGDFCAGKKARSDDS